MMEEVFISQKGLDPFHRTVFDELSFLQELMDSTEIFSYNKINNVIIGDY